MNTQALIALCPDCDRPIPTAAPEGLCPACLAQSAVDEPISDPANTPANQPFANLRFFGDYELIRELGRGAMGVVHLAHQLGVNRPVALKLLVGGAAAGRDFIHRFHTEAATAARLDHPGIVPIYEFGTHDGAYYLAMKYIEGGTLADRLKAATLEPTEIARIMIRIAQAVQHAHQHGILHRDLKPGNILLDTDGQPYVADFGLARLLEADSTLTLSHAIVGTAAYLAPEIARAGASQATTASDIYSLGSVLYELLAGHPPFTGASLAEVLRKVQEEEPRLPKSEGRRQKSEKGRRISDLRFAICDLDTICLKSLDKEPSRRYPTAQALADDLQRFLNDEPILARPVTRLERAVRWCRRKPALASTSLLILLLLLILIVASPIAAYRIDQARQLAQQEARNASQNLYFAQIRLADRALVEGNPGHTARLLEQWIPTTDSDEDRRDWEWHYLWNQVKSDAAFELGRHDSLIRSIAVSPNAELAASSDFAGGVSIWDLRNRQRLASFTKPDMVHQVLFHSDSMLLTGGANGVLEFYDLHQARFVRALDLGLPVRALALSRDRSTLAAHCGDQDLAAMTHVWRLGQPSEDEHVASLNQFQTIQSPRAGWWWYLGGAVAFSPSGEEIAIGEVDNLIRIYATATGTLRMTLGLETPNGGISTLVYASDGRSLISQGVGGLASNEMQVWNLDTGELKATMHVQDRGVRELCLSADGEWLIAADANQGIRLWNTSTWSLHQSYMGHRGEIHALAVAPFGTLALSGDTDGRILAWDYSQPSRRVQPLTFTHCRVLRFSPSGNLVATVEPAADQGAAFRVGIRVAPDLGLSRELPALGDDVLDVAFSPDEQQLAAINPDSLRLWDLRGDRTVQSAELPASNTRSLIGFSRDGQRILLLGHDGLVTTWNTETRQWEESWSVRTTDLEPAAFDQRNVAFHAGSATLVVGFKGAATVWDAETRQLRGQLTGHSIWRVQPAISWDGRTIATLGEDGDRTVRLWNARTMELLGILDTPPQLIHGPSFSPNGDRIAISHGRFGAASIYDVTTGTQIITLPAQPADFVRRTQWSPDGSTLALHGHDAVLWRLPLAAQPTPQSPQTRTRTEPNVRL